MATNKEFVKLALDQSGDEYIFGVEVSPANPNPTAFDCSELVQWCCDRLSVNPRMVDGSWYQARHCKQYGLLVSIDKAIKTAGALLFKFSSSPWEGGRPNNAHVAISLGDGWTIEARGRAYGVGTWSAAQGQRGWTHAGLVPGLKYVETGGVSAPKPNDVVDLADVWASVDAARKQTLRLGSQGEAVRVLQKLLNAAGFTAGAVDGWFGRATDSAVRRFQAAEGLVTDGVVGRFTWAKLLG